MSVSHSGGEIKEAGAGKSSDLGETFGNGQDGGGMKIQGSAGDHQRSECEQR